MVVFLKRAAPLMGTAYLATNVLVARTLLRLSHYHEVMGHVDVAAGIKRWADAVGIDFSAATNMETGAALLAMGGVLLKTRSLWLQRKQERHDSGQPSDPAISFLGLKRP